MCVDVLVREMYFDRIKSKRISGSQVLYTQDSLSDEESKTCLSAC